MKRRFLIFDMDGTLVDSGYDITESVNFVRRIKNLEPLSQSEVESTINTNEANVFKVFYNTKELNETDKKNFENHYYEQCIKNTYPYDDIPELLKKLKDIDAHLVVATNSPTIYAKKILKHLELDSYFSHILGSCDVKKRKPDPEIIIRALMLSKFDTKKFFKPVMIGDNHKDMDAANSAKIDSIYVTWGFGDGEPNTIKAMSPLEIIEILKNQN